MYLTLKSLSVTEDLTRKKVKAKLEGQEIVKVQLTISADNIADLEDVLQDLSKGAVFELKIEPVRKMNTGLSRFLEEVEV